MKVIGGCAHGRSGRRGLTLVECMWALVILPLAVTAVSLAVVASQAQAVEALRRERATALANDLMEEILSLPYDPATDDSLGAEEANRWSYDSPTDFHGFTEAADSVNRVDRLNGTEVLYPDSQQRFSRAVTITACECGGADTCASSLCELFGAGTSLGAKILTVTVTVSDQGESAAEVTRHVVEVAG